MWAARLSVTQSVTLCSVAELVCKLLIKLKISPALTGRKKYYTLAILVFQPAKKSYIPLNMVLRFYPVSSIA